MTDDIAAYLKDAREKRDQKKADDLRIKMAKEETERLQFDVLCRPLYEYVEASFKDINASLSDQGVNFTTQFSRYSPRSNSNMPSVTFRALLSNKKGYYPHSDFRLEQRGSFVMLMSSAGDGLFHTQHGRAPLNALADSGLLTEGVKLALNEAVRGGF